MLFRLLLFQHVFECTSAQYDDRHAQLWAKPSFRSYCSDVALEAEYSPCLFVWSSSKCTDHHDSSAPPLTQEFYTFHPLRSTHFYITLFPSILLLLSGIHDCVVKLDTVRQTLYSKSLFGNRIVVAVLSFVFLFLSSSFGPLASCFVKDCLYVCSPRWSSPCGVGGTLKSRN